MSRDQLELRLPIMGATGATQLQNNGYKNTASAIAEIVDNSIQAGSSKIDINLITKFEGGSHRVHNIVMIDNGDGMNAETLSKSLQFQGGNHHHATQGLGRYGMGLPSSSCSQTKHFEVYTWQDNGNGQRNLLHTYLDLDEMEKNENPFLNPVIEKDSIDNRNIDAVFTNMNDYSSGTIVYWEDVNRLTWKTIEKLIEHLKGTLGRKFRYYLNDNSLKIDINAYDDNGHEFEELRQHSSEIKVFDPMFLMSNTMTKDEAECSEFEGITSTQYGEETHKTFKQNIRLENGEDKVVEHKIRIKFSHIKKEVREYYKSGNQQAGGTRLGLLYKNRKDININYPIVSVLRANREIDHNHYGFIALSTGTAYEMERWVSVEVFIDNPESDWIFDIDNRKQQARIYKLTEASDFKDEVHKYISGIINGNVVEMRGLVSTQLTAKNKNPGTNNGIDIGKIVEELIPVPDPDSDDLGETDITPEEKQELTNWITDIYPDLKKDNNKLKLKNVIKWCLALPCRHYIIYRPLGEMDLYSFKMMGTDRTVIEINTNHSFYKNFIHQVEEDNNEQAKDILRLLFSSLVSAEQQTTANSQEQSRMLRRIRTNMALELNDFIEALLEA